MNTADGRLRLGLVGCGRLAELGYVPAVVASGRFRLAAVADPSAERSAALALAARRAEPEAPAVETFGGVEELVSAADVDAIVIANPVDAHVGAAEVATAAGIPVLVEKPPAPDGDGARRLAALGDLVRIGFNRRFVPQIAALRQRLAGVESYRSALAFSYRRASWSPVSVRDDALLDLGPHLVDLVRWLLRDEVVEVLRADLGPERAAVQLRLGRGTAAIALRTDGVYSERIAVTDRSTGMTGSYRVGGVADAVRSRVLRRGGGDALVGSLTGQLDAFAAAVGDPQRRSWGLGTGADGVAVMEAIDAIRAVGQPGTRGVRPLLSHTGQEGSDPSCPRAT